MSAANTENLGDIFDLAATADRTALIDCREWDNPREYTYGELDVQANACARPNGRGLGGAHRPAVRDQQSP